MEFTRFQKKMTKIIQQKEKKEQKQQKKLEKNDKIDSPSPQKSDSKREKLKSDYMSERNLKDLPVSSVEGKIGSLIKNQGGRKKGNEESPISFSKSHNDDDNDNDESGGGGLNFIPILDELKNEPSNLNSDSNVDIINKFEDEKEKVKPTPILKLAPTAFCKPSCCYNFQDLFYQEFKAVLIQYLESYTGFESAVLKEISIILGYMDDEEALKQEKIAQEKRQKLILKAEEERVKLEKKERKLEEKREKKKRASEKKKKGKKEIGKKEIGKGNAKVKEKEKEKEKGKEKKEKEKEEEKKNLNVGSGDKVEIQLLSPRAQGEERKKQRYDRTTTLKRVHKATAASLFNAS